MWFSLYMLLIQFVDMHLLFLFSFFWLLLSFFFQSAIFNTMWWTFRLVQGKKKKPAIFLLFRPLKKYLATIWMRFVPTQKTNKKNQTEATIRTKRPLTTESQPQEFLELLSAAAAFACMTHVWDSWERPGPSGASPPLSSLLPPPFSRLSIPPPPAAWWEAERHPGDTHNRPSCLHKSLEWTDSGCHARKKTTTRLIFFFFSPPPKNTKKTA